MDRIRLGRGSISFEICHQNEVKNLAQPQKNKQTNLKIGQRPEQIPNKEDTLMANKHIKSVLHVLKWLRNEP